MIYVGQPKLALNLPLHIFMETIKLLHYKNFHLQFLWRLPNQNRISKSKITRRRRWEGVAFQKSQIAWYQWLMYHRHLLFYLSKINIMQNTENKFKKHITYCVKNFNSHWLSNHDHVTWRQRGSGSSLGIQLHSVRVWRPLPATHWSQFEIFERTPLLSLSPCCWSDFTAVPAERISKQSSFM